MIAQHRDLDLAPHDAFLDQDFHGELRGQIQGGRQFLTRMNLGHAHRRAKRGGFDEDWIFEFFLDDLLNFFGIALPIGAQHGNPRHDGDFGDLEETLGNILVHANGGAEHAGTDERQAREVQQPLDRAVFTVGAVHDREDDVNALAATAAAAVERNQRGVGGVGGHHHPLAALQHFREHLLRSVADEPVAFFGDADGYSFVFVRVQAADDGSGRGERNFMFAGATAKEDANAESFLVVRAHGSNFSPFVELPRYQL